MHRIVIGVLAVAVATLLGVLVLAAPRLMRGEAILHVTQTNDPRWTKITRADAKLVRYGDYLRVCRCSMGGSDTPSADDLVWVVAIAGDYDIESSGQVPRRSAGVYELPLGAGIPFLPYSGASMGSVTNTEAWTPFFDGLPDRAPRW